MGRGRPVMADVAREAGVSVQTVSRVLNDHPHVGRLTRIRVLGAIDRLGYRLNHTARALATRRYRTFGVVSFDTTLYGPASTVHGVRQAARAAGYVVSVVSLKSIDSSGLHDALGHLAGQGVDGVVVVAPQCSAAEIQACPTFGLPVVAASTVGVDQAEGARLATEHLLALGHETVWHIRGPSEWLEADERVSGWRAALERRGLAVPEPLLGDWSARFGYEAGRRLGAGGEVTAVFAANDQMALGVLRALTELGVAVPGRVSIVGFDDLPESAYFSPPLTTVRQDFREVGRRSIEALLRQIAGQEGERAVTPPVFVRRASTAAPPTDDLSAR